MTACSLGCKVCKHDPALGILQHFPPQVILRVLMILPSASVRYLLTAKTNYGLGQGHSTNPTRVRQRNGECSDPSLKQVAQGLTLSMAEAIRKALVLLMVGQLKTQSWATAGDPKGDISHRTTSVYFLLLGKHQTQSKCLVKCLILFCFPQLKQNLSYYFAAFGEIRPELISSITFQITSSE